MLRLSKKTDYALILLSHMCVECGPASAQEMATRYHLPQPMVANILKQLSSAGVIESRRGQQGGYTLARRPEDLSLSTLINIIDQPFNLVACAHGHGHCEVSDTCPTTEPLVAFHARLQAFLEGMTLRDIVAHPKFNQSPRSDSDEAAHLS